MKSAVNIVIILSIFFPIITFANSGDIIVNKSYSGTVGSDIKSFSLDDKNNIYIVSQDSTTKDYSVSIIEKFIDPTVNSGSVINITSSGSTTRSINDWIHEFAQSDIFAFGNLIVGLLFYITIIIGSLVYGLYYGFRFFTPKKVK